MAASFSFTVLVFIALTSTNASTIPKFPRVISKLIHRDYNSNATIVDLVERAINRSIARYVYLWKKVNEDSSVINDIKATVLANDAGTDFIVNFSMGTPPVPQLVLMDTGSNLLWVQCNPCSNCIKQSGPLFDPSKSTSFVKTSCMQPNCYAAPNGSCDPHGKCIYAEKYADGMTTVGELAMEQLLFETSDEGTIILPHVVIGCGHDNKGPMDGQVSGILGLGPKTIGLPYRTGSAFSYCIGDIMDPHYAYNQLILGSGTIMEGVSTPLSTYLDTYFLTLEGISVGEKKLNIDPVLFMRTPQGTGGVVIDSGSSATWLVTGGFIPLRNEIQALVDGRSEQVFNLVQQGDLCFKGNFSRDLGWFPQVKFHFAGGADLVLDIQNLFIQVSLDAYCMAVFESDMNDVSLIGVITQQNYNVAYDLVNYKVYFQKIDCRFLID